MRNLGTSKKMIQLPIEEAPLQFNDPAEVHVYNERIDRIEARGLGFSELQSNFGAWLPTFFWKQFVILVHFVY